MCLEHSHKPTVEQNHQTQAYWIIVLNTLYNVLNTVLKVKKKKVNVSVVYRCNHMTDWELRLNASCPESRESILPHITSPGKGQNSKFDFFMKLKNLQSNHHKSGTVCDHLYQSGLLCRVIKCETV